MEISLQLDELGRIWYIRVLFAARQMKNGDMSVGERNAFF